MGWMTRVQFLAEAGIFLFITTYKTGSEADPVSYPISSMVSFPQR
jgi:hypothetical protein